MSQHTPHDAFYARTPYVEAFDIDYPQENLEGELHKYRCRHCKRLTTDINGRLDGHAQDCAYRLMRTRRAGEHGPAPCRTPE